jgi:hypothetical protein
MHHFLCSSCHIKESRQLVLPRTFCLLILYIVLIQEYYIFNTIFKRVLPCVMHSSYNNHSVLYFHPSLSWYARKQPIWQRGMFFAFICSLNVVAWLSFLFTMHCMQVFMWSSIYLRQWRNLGMLYILANCISILCVSTMEIANHFFCSAVSCCTYQAKYKY